MTKWARRKTGCGFGLALTILVCGGGLAPQAWGEDASSDWLLNSQDGSEEQVKSTVAGAEALLHPAAQAPSEASHRPFVAPATRGEGYPDLDVPNPPWHYDTEYFFGLSRGVFRESIPGAIKGLSLIGTVPLDLAGLPVASLAGLFGS